ncbi:MAG: hypothetical protein LBC86_04950, partial [Oscillospiraceae bacterium]|nr:hypothetical protein [Oscillospiraceae bacterium]
FHSFNLNGFPLRERSGRCRNSASPFNLKSETLFKLKDYNFARPVRFDSAEVAYISIPHFEQFSHGFFGSGIKRYTMQRCLL